VFAFVNAACKGIGHNSCLWHLPSVHWRNDVPRLDGCKVCWLLHILGEGCQTDVLSFPTRQKGPWWLACGSHFLSNNLPSGSSANMTATCAHLVREAFSKSTKCLRGDLIFLHWPIQPVKPMCSYGRIGVVPGQRSHSICVACGKVMHYFLSKKGKSGKIPYFYSILIT